MKIRERESTVAQNFDPIESHEVSLSKDKTALIIERLIDIYKDTAAAIIREYSSNARDSHIEAGKHDVPIEVTTPKYGNSHLKIRDFGVGLDSAGLKTYVSLGESTKNESNDQTGAYGLGCKSALAFTSQFTVIAVKDGVKRYASVGRNRENKFSIEVFKVVETDEINGVEVKIPIPEERRAEVTQKAEDFFQYWERGTVLLNGKQPDNYRDSVSNPETDIVETPSGVVYVSANRGFGRDAVHVVMGNVAYLVEMDRVLNHMYKDSNSVSAYSSLLSFGLDDRAKAVLYADIGSIDLVPSRDSLKYSSYTLETIVDLLKKTYNGTVDVMNERLESATSYAEAENTLLATKNIIADGVIRREMKDMEAGKDHWAKLVNRTYGDVEYDLRVQGIPNPNFSKKDEEKAIKSVDDEIESLDNSGDTGYYFKRSELDRKKRQIQKDRYATVKLADASFGGGLVHPRVSGYGVDTNVLVDTQERDVTLPGVRSWLNGGSGEVKRTIIWWNSDDGVTIDNIEDFRISKHKQKFSLWMREHKLSTITILVGEFENNPWIFENDNYTIVKGSDFEKEVADKRKRLREEGRAAAPARVQTETQYDALVVNEETKFANIVSLPISEMEADTIIYTTSKDLPSRSMGKLAYYYDENTIIVAINKSRSVNKFLERAEKHNKKVIKLVDWATEMNQMLVSNENLRKLLLVHKERELIGSILSDIISGAKNVRRSAEIDDTRYLENPAEVSELIKNLEISGQSLQYWIDVSENSISYGRNSDLSHLSEFEQELYNNQGVFNSMGLGGGDYGLTEPPSSETLKSDYPMLKVASFYVHREAHTVIEYIDMMNKVNADNQK